MGALEEALMKLIPGLAPKAPAVRAHALDIKVTAKKVAGGILEGLSVPAEHAPEGKIRVGADEVGHGAVLRGANRRDGRKKAE